MYDKKTLSNLAVLYELNDREFKRKLTLFPEELRYYVVLASSIIGAENSKRVKETPKEVVENSKGFVEKMLELSTLTPDDAFRGILETYLIETLKDELRFNCPNCMEFNRCIDMESGPVGELFQRRVYGEETDELKKEIKSEIDKILKKAPYIDTDDAPAFCRNFTHNYSSSSLGEILGRYADIAASLRNDFGIDYEKIQQQMIALNMEFYEKSRRHMS